MWFKNIISGVAVLGMAFSINVMAEVQQLEAPAPFEPLESGQPLGSEVTIEDSTRETIYEYRRNGELVMVKVQPKAAGMPAYYFIADDKGELQYSSVNPNDVMNVNQWVLFRW